MALAVAASAVAVAGLHAQQDPVVRALTEPWPMTDKMEGIEILPVLKEVFMLVGAGANVTVQAGEEGVVLVDSGAAGRTDALLAAVRHLTRRPIRYLVNTGPDGDHTGGNGPVVRAAGGLLGEGPAGAREAAAAAVEEAVAAGAAGTSAAPAPRARPPR